MPDALDKLIDALKLDSEFARRYDNPPWHPQAPSAHTAAVVDLYSDAQERDDHGRWTSGGGGDGPSAVPGHTMAGIANSQKINDFFDMPIGTYTPTVGQDLEVSIAKLRGEAKANLVANIGAGIAQQATTNPLLAEQLQGFKLQASLQQGFKFDEQGNGVPVDRAGPPTEPTIDELAQAAAQNYVNSWAKTAADHDGTAIALQQTASAEFQAGSGSFNDYVNREMALESQQEKIFDPQGDGIGWLQQSTQDIKASEGEVMKAFVHETYDQTQAQLQDIGIGPNNPVTLYRGMSFPTGAPVSGDHPVDLNPISSWTTDRGTAFQFGLNFQGTATADLPQHTLLTMTVPARDIYSTAKTGQGALIEWEALVLNRPDHKANFVRVES